MKASNYGILISIARIILTISRFSASVFAISAALKRFKSASYLALDASKKRMKNELPGRVEIQKEETKADDESGKNETEEENNY